MNTYPDNEPKLSQQEYDKAIYALRKLSEIQNPQLHRMLLGAQQGYFDDKGVEILKALWHQDARYRPFIEEAMVYLRTLLEKNQVQTMVQAPPTPLAKGDVRNEIIHLFQKPELLSSILESHMKDKGFGKLQFLAKGGMGAVYAAENLNLSRPCVIKISLASEDIRMAQAFEKEARMAAQVSKHGSIVEIYDAGTMNISGQSVNYYVMEHVGGGDAHDLIHQIESGEKELSRTEALKMIQDIASGLAVIHRNGMTHRDMKPANILIDRIEDQQVAKISDFGLASARFLDRSPTEVMDGTEDSMESLTCGGAVIGTPAFMPEEAWRDPQSAGPAWDIHALGLIAAGLLTGHTKAQEYTFGKKFNTGRDYGVAYMMSDYTSAISYFDPGIDSLRDTPEDEELLEFLCQMTARAPEDRPTADEVVEFVEQQFSERSEATLRMRSLKKKATAAFVSLVGIFGASALLYFGTRRPQEHVDYARELADRKAQVMRVLNQEGRKAPELLKKLVVDLEATLAKKSQLSGFEPQEGEITGEELKKLIQQARQLSAAQESLDSALLFQKNGKHNRCLESLTSISTTAPKSLRAKILEVMNASRYALCIRSYHMGEIDAFNNYIAELDISKNAGLSNKQQRKLSRFKILLSRWEGDQYDHIDEVKNVLGWKSSTPEKIESPQQVLLTFQKWVTESENGDSTAFYKALTLYAHLMNYATEKQKGLNRQEMAQLLQTDATYGSIARLVPSLRKTLVKVLAQLEPQTSTVPGLTKQFQILSLEMVSYYQSIIYTRLNTPNLPASMYRGLIDRAVPVFKLILALEKNTTEANMLDVEIHETLKKAAKDTWRKIEGEMPRQYTKALVDLVQGSEVLKKMVE